MPEIIIRQIAFGADGGSANLANGIELPIDNETLGRHFAANDFADSLTAVPPDMMEHFDYDLLGRMGWDDHTNVFVKGHHV